jgi:hypothetical protein
VATAAAGDTVKAVLTTDLRDQSKRVLAPKGTPVLCRILRIRRGYFYDFKYPALDGRIHTSRRLDFDRPSASVELLLGLENFALPEGLRPVYARPDRGRSASPPQAGTLQSRPGELGPLNAMARNQWLANFLRAGDDYVIESGLESNWVTVAP